MNPDWPVLIFVALVALLWAAHHIDRWVSRRRVRAYLRATLLDSLRRDLARAESERDEVADWLDDMAEAWGVDVPGDCALAESALVVARAYLGADQ